jgi:hypothetical protein
MIIKGILKKLKSKKLDIFVRDLGEYGRFQGVLMDMNEEVIILKSKYNKIIYIPISEIVIVTEHDIKTESIRAKLKDRIVRDTIVNSLAIQEEH